MDSNYANAGGGSGFGSTTAAGISASASDRYNQIYYKDPVSCQRGISYNTYDPYGGLPTGARTSSVYPYDAEAEFKERTGMGKVKTAHLQMAVNAGSNGVKQYNPNSCYGSYNQATASLTPSSSNYYAYAYDQHHHLYPQQQQYHQSELQQQYKYKVAGQQQQQLLHHHHQQQQQQQQHQQQQNALSAAMKMSPPEYGYAPYHHPYYHPHYHHSQKGGVSVMKTLPDASAMPYVSSKMLHSATMGGSRASQYPPNYYHPYPSSAVAAGHHHHTYQSQSVCDDSRWMCNTNNSNTSNGSDYQNSCRDGYPTTKQATMWPHSMPLQYQNTMSTGYPAAAASVSNQNCCSASGQSSSAYYTPQQYAKYSVNFNSSNSDLYSNTQVNSPAAPSIASTKVYTDLNAQPQANAYQTMNASVSSVSYHQPGDCSVSTTLDCNARYLQQQQTDSPSASSTSSTSSYNHHYYHPYAHQTYSTAGPQEAMYVQQQVDAKIGLNTTKSQSLRDFLTSWNEDEDECSDRTMNSTDVPYIEQLHLTAEHFTPSQDNSVMENHLQFKGSFSSRPKIHVGITVDSTVESDQYINLPDIIIDIEKSNKEVPPETILIPKEEKLEEKTTCSSPPPQNRRKFPRLTQLQKLRLANRKQRKSKKVLCRQLKIRRLKKRNTNTNTDTTNIPPLQLNPPTLKCLCVSLINSDKFRNRILGPSKIVESLINHLFTDDNEAASIVDGPAAPAAPASVVDTSSSVIPKLSDLCKNALNSSFDRDVLVINLDEILDSDNLFVVQCDINENILENYVDVDVGVGVDVDQQPEEQLQQQSDADLVEILNDNNNNSNYIPTAVSEATTTSSRVTPKRCCSVTEVSNLPLDNPVEHNNLNSNTNPMSVIHSTSPAPPSSPRSSSCPAVLCYRSSSSSPSPLPLPAVSPSLIEQNCSTKQTPAAAGGHEQLHEMLMLSNATGIVHDNISAEDHHHHNNNNNNLSNDSDLLMLDTTSTPSIHHEEIVPDNLKKFQNEKFLKYLHAKYVQGNLSEFYHANRIIKKYKKRIIKKMLNIVVR